MVDFAVEEHQRSELQTYYILSDAITPPRLPPRPPSIGPPPVRVSSLDSFLKGVHACAWFF